MNAFALEAEGISKFFPGVKALDNVSLRVRPGTVHALMGENGAGKSTLMKCLIGIYRPDKGSIRVKGEPVEFTDTMDALRSGISMIHQELNLVPHMTVAENIWLGREPMKYGFVDHGQLTRQTQALLDKLNIRLTADRLVGAGRSEVMESLFGMERFDSGEVLIDGAPVTIDSPSVAIEKGMALLTEDRKKSGLFLVLSVLENMSIVKMPEYIGKSGFVQHVKMAEDCMEQIRRLNIKTPTMDQIINNLSGGNQQKVLIARWLLAQPKILILDEPTRGIDVGAKAEIYHLISELANRGVAVIMVSSELPEILGMSDRVMVMHEGRITGILEKDEADQETILSLASH
ncbi:sugar ABC transporter ATP-binding protein [Klebsiella pneumoniae]